MRGFVADDPATPTHPLLDARVVRLTPPEFPFDEAFSDAVPGVVDGPVDVPTVLCGTDSAASYLACVQEADLMRRPLRGVGIHRRAFRLWHRSQRSDHAPFWAAGYPAIQITDIAEFRNARHHCRFGQDTVDTLDPVFLRQVGQANVGSVAPMPGLQP